MFGLYQSWTKRHELRIAPYRRIQSRQPISCQLSRDEDSEFFAGFDFYSNVSGASVGRWAFAK
jgi:hypothetical protein